MFAIRRLARRDDQARGQPRSLCPMALQTGSHARLFLERRLPPMVGQSLERGLGTHLLGRCVAAKIISAIRFTVVSCSVVCSSLPNFSRMCGVIACVALHTLSPGQSAIPQPHPLSADQPARSALLLNESIPATSLKQMRLNLRIGCVNFSRPASTPAAGSQTTMVRR